MRIPTLRAHSEAITIETEKPITPQAARDALSKFPGIKVVDDPAKKQYPMPLTATNSYDVEVGRVRQNIVFGDHGLDLFVCGDQVRAEEGRMEGGKACSRPTSPHPLLHPSIPTAAAWGRPQRRADCGEAVGMHKYIVTRGRRRRRQVLVLMLVVGEF